MKLTRQFRKLKNSYFRVAVATCLFVIFVVPFVSKYTGTDVIGGMMVNTNTCYSVVLNGIRIGVVEDPEIAKDSLAKVRRQINNQYGQTTYVDANLELSVIENYRGRITAPETLQTTLYNNVAASVYVPNDVVYTVRIDDFMVTVASEQDVIDLLEAAKSRIAGTEQFNVEMVNVTDDSGISQTTVNVASADKKVNEAAKVLATIDGTDTVRVDETTVFEDCVLYVGFDEDIEIIKTTSRNSSVTPVDEALEMITKEKAEKGTYEVVSGDCLSAIAEKTNISLNELYAMNEGLNANSTLYPGDLLTITVPKPELSVIVKEEVTYEESFDAPIKYVDNNSLYQGQENVISYGTPGYREVIAVVSYSNGVEYSRELLSQTVLTEPVATVVERGTLIPPTFIKPVNSSTYTSYWGGRVHPITGAWSTHTGLDIYVPLGTSVRASCAGTVTYSGWNGGYGVCVIIDHGNGVTTKYAHLNQTDVSVGQQVSQGQRVGLSGSTGNSTGPHLHFEVCIWGTSKNPLDYIGY